MDEETLEGNDLIRCNFIPSKELSCNLGVSWIPVEQRQPFLCATLYTIAGLPCMHG